MWGYTGAVSSRASRTKPCPACGTAVWLDPGEIWAKCTSCGRKIHRGEVKDEERAAPASALSPSTVAPSTVTTPQTRRTIYLLAIVPLVLAIIAGLASFFSHDEHAKPRPRGATSSGSGPAPSTSLSDAAPPG